MNLVWGFAPFIVFSLIDHALGLWQGLIAALLVAIAVLFRHRMEGRSTKILEVGSAILFAALALFVFATGADLSFPALRALVDTGLLAIAIVSIVIGTPFTIQYAKETTPQQHWNSPLFRRANLVISLVWALSFAVNALADFVLVLIPEAPAQLATLFAVATLVASLKFTKWYPKYLHRKAESEASTVA